MKQKMKSRIWALVRFVLGFSLAAFLINDMIGKSGIDIRQELSQSLWSWILVALAAYGVAHVSSFIRWYTLLKGQGIEMPLMMVFKVGFIGAFFNTVIPGAVSGDLVKMGYIFKHQPSKRPEAVMSVMVDRILGLLGLFTIAIVACLFSVQFLRETDSQVVRVGTLTILIVSVCSSVGVFGIIFRRQLQKLPLVSPIIDFFKAKLPERLRHILERLVTALDLYKAQKKMIFLALFFSIIVHGMNGVALIALGEAVQENHGRAEQYFLTIQVSNTVAIAPVVPGGIGLRDKFTAEFLKAFDIDKEKANIIPIFFTFVIAFWSLVGALIFAITRVEKPDELDSLRDPADQAADSD